MTVVAANDVSLRRLTVAEYDRMVEAGIIGADERVELLDGAIVQMPPIGPEHANAVSQASAGMVRNFGDRAVVRPQCPIHLGVSSKPEPDVALVRPPAARYRKRHPEPEDILLLVEVSDTTLAQDRRVKVPLYAQARIPELWLLDLRKRRLLVFRSPDGEAYGDVRTLKPTDQISPLAFPGRLMRVSDLFDA